MEIVSFTNFINSINLRDVFMLNRNIDSNSAGKLNAGTKGVITLVNHLEKIFTLSIVDQNNFKTGDEIEVNYWNVDGFCPFWDKLDIESTKPTTNTPFAVHKEGSNGGVDTFEQAVQLLGLGENRQFVVGSRWMVVNPCKIGDVIFNKGEIFTFDKDGFAYVKHYNLAKITLNLSLVKDAEKFTLALKTGGIKPIGFKPKKGVSYVDVITEEPIQVGSIIKTKGTRLKKDVWLKESVYGIVKGYNKRLDGYIVIFEQDIIKDLPNVKQHVVKSSIINDVLQNVAHRNVPKDDLEKYSVAKLARVEKEVLVPTKDDSAVIGKHYYNADGVEYVALQCAYSPFVCKPDHTGFTTIGVRNLYEKELKSAWEYPKTMHRKPTAWVKVI